jgi:hypothetical protein
MKVKNKSKLFTIIIILFSMLFLTGITLSIISTMNIFSNVKLATVIELNDKTIKVKIGEQNGDPIIYELKKYKIFNIKENDNIYINVKNNKVKYSIKPIDSDKLEKIGIILISAPFLILSLGIMFFILILLPIAIIKFNKLSIIQSIPIISFSIGTLMIILSTEENSPNIFIIIGFLLIFFSPLYMQIYEKRKKK